MKKTVASNVLSLACLFGALALFAETSEISVELKMDAVDYVVGERVRAVVDVANSSPDVIRCGAKGTADRFFVEVFRASDGAQLEPTVKRPYVAAFRVDSSEGQKLETFLGDHYALLEPSRYLAKPVLVHRGIRYEGTPRAFDIVEGLKVGGALQMFTSVRDLRRSFALVHWSRGDREHLFLRAKDEGASHRTWETRDLGAVLRIGKPTVSILPTGEVVVLHRMNADQFVRTEFWSLPQAFEFRSREAVQDPETAGTQRVRELYKEGGVKPKSNPWWKFW